MPEIIMDAADLAEILDASPEDEVSDLTATKQADPETMDFHIQMRGYTMRDFEVMMVSAAAQQLIAGRDFKKDIQAEATRIAGEKMAVAVSDSLQDVMKTTLFMRGKDPVTLGQMIGMESKEYLLAKVDPRSGEPITSSWGEKGVPQIQFLAAKMFQAHFKAELEAASKQLKEELSAAVSAQIAASIAEKRAEIAKAIGYEITKIR